MAIGVARTIPTPNNSVNPIETRSVNEELAVPDAGSASQYV
jgi:hypothetical protein